MSFGRPGNFSDAFTGAPPEKGSFPLDHDHDCSPAMKRYLACLKENKNKNEKCRALSKAYLQCRFDNGLMEKAEWPSLGFPDDPVLPTPPSGSSSSSTPTPLTTMSASGGTTGTGAGSTGILGGSKPTGV